MFAVRDIACYNHFPGWRQGYCGAIARQLGKLDADPALIEAGI